MPPLTTATRTWRAKPKLDAVLICTPPSTHEEIAVFFLNRGIPVLCEKPFCVSTSGAARGMMRRGRGAQLRRHSRWRPSSAMSTTSSGPRASSGRASWASSCLFENAFTSRVDMTTQWNSDPAISGGGVLIDNGTHSVDIMRYFLGSLADVQVVEGKRTQGLQVEDTVRIFVHSQSGVMGGIDLSWSINKEQESVHQHLRLARGKYDPGRLERIAVPRAPLAAGIGYVFGKGYDKVQDAFRRRSTTSRAAIRGDEPLFLITAEDAIASAEVVDAAYASLRQKPSWTAVAAGAPVAQRAQFRPTNARPSVSVFVHPTAMIEKGVTLGEGTSVWDNVHIRHGASIGEQCIVGEKSYIAYDVKIGNRVKINAFVYICAAVTIEDGVMIAAGDDLHTNGRFPSARRRRICGDSRSSDARRTHASDPGPGRFHHRSGMHHRQRPDHRTIRHDRNGLRRHSPGSGFSPGDRQPCPIHRMRYAGAEI